MLQIAVGRPLQMTGPFLDSETALAQRIVVCSWQRTVLLIHHFRRGQHAALFLDRARLVQQEPRSSVVQQNQVKEVGSTARRAHYAARR